MSHLRSIIEIIQNLIVEDVETNNLLKEIDEMNIENARLESQLEEVDREHVRLQMEFYNLETTTSFNDVTVISNFNEISRKMYKDCLDLKSLINKIEFKKILQCYHMEMEAKLLKEWQPIEKCLVRTLNLQQQMRERHIVQKYRQVEFTLSHVKEAKNNQLEAMKKFFNQHFKLIYQAKVKRNNLVVVLVKGSKDLDEFNRKVIQEMKLSQYKVYIEGLRQKKLKIRNELDQTYIKALNPTFNSNINQTFAITRNPATELFSLIMPKFPSFSDILESFYQAEKQANLASIESSTSFCGKSILQNSKKSTTPNKQPKNVHFKTQLENYKEETSEIETETEKETDSDEIQLKTTAKVREVQDNGENLQEIKVFENVSDIETIDLLTPVDNKVKMVKETKEVVYSLGNGSSGKHISNKPKIEIQNCVVFKTPFPLEELEYFKNQKQDKENIPKNINLNISKHSAELCSSSSSQQSIKQVLNRTKKSFYEEFFNTSSSAEESPKIPKNSFESFLTENRDSVFSSKNSNEVKTSNIAAQNNSTELQDFLDFGFNKRFSFDSDDNTDIAKKSGNMNFM